MLKARVSMIAFLLATAWLALGPGLGTLEAAASAGAIRGTVTGPDGKPLAGVPVQLRNDITGFKAETVSNRDGGFQFFSVPFNPYEIHVEVQGFESAHMSVDVRSSVPKEVGVKLELLKATASVTVQGEPTAAQLETDTSMSHIDIDKSYIARAPAAVASARHGADRDIDARLRQGRERALSLPGRAQPERIRHRRPDDLGPDRRHVLELDRSRHRSGDRGDLRQRPGGIRREDRRRDQPDHQVRPGTAPLQGRRVRRRLALFDRRRRGLGWRPARRPSASSLRELARGRTDSSIPSTRQPAQHTATPSAASCASTTLRRTRDQRSG